MKTLSPVEQKFILHWGEMGTKWGINRTVAQIHALLYITGQPQCTDDVMERLNISRGNASMSLRALCDWGIIRRMHKRGERREYFESLGDVWEMFSIIAAERNSGYRGSSRDTEALCRAALEAGVVDPCQRRGHVLNLRPGRARWCSPVVGEIRGV